MKNTHTSLLRTASLFTLLAFTAAPVVAQTGSMLQGNEEIIIQGSARIQESIEEMEAETDSAMPKIYEIKKTISDYATKSQDATLTRDEQLAHNAKALEARAKLHADYKKIVHANQGRLEKIDAELRAMITVSRSMDNPSKEVTTQTEAVERLIEQALQGEEQLKEMVSTLPTEAISDATFEDFESSARMIAASEKAAEMKQEAYQGYNNTSRFEQLQGQVSSRRHQLYLTAKIIDDNIQRIRMTTINNMTVATIWGLDKSLASIATLDDPLGLDVLQPGFERQLLLDPGSSTGGISSSPAAPSRTGRRLRTSADFR